jgi:hypothetical protein
MDLPILRYGIYKMAFKYVKITKEKKNKKQNLNATGLAQQSCSAHGRLLPAPVLAARPTCWQQKTGEERAVHNGEL